MAPSPSAAGARAAAKQLKALMPPSLHKLRISDELAGCFDAGEGGGGGPSALVVSPFGKVWRVEVGRDGDGAFLGRGWAEFLAAHGVGVGWFVVLGHAGRGALTFKAFDTSFCIKEFAAPAAVHIDIYISHFLQLWHLEAAKGFPIIPARFVKHYVTEYLNSRTAVVLSPLGKLWQIELENNPSGMFFAGGWSQFLEFHGISKGDILLLRYEGNMVFKVKAFGLNGHQKYFKNQDAGILQNVEMQQESLSPIMKRKNHDEKSSSEENKRPKGSVTYLNTKLPLKKPDYQIGPSSWIRKEINTYALECLLVRGAAYKTYGCMLGDGWKSFCQENRLKTGNLCTFNIIETTLWHVTIKRSPTSAYMKRQKVSPCSSNKEHETKKVNSSSEERVRPKCSTNSLSKASKCSRSVYEIGPPSWVQKEMNHNSIARHLSLALNFCSRIGLQKHCTITLKTSANSSRSWQWGKRLEKTGPESRYLSKITGSVGTTAHTT
ncbi:hypothetical protein C2845_PM15G04540 [Panicum miliaceum]|uniref:TF-B3 domain-containing protein n=1 Tax=Panicum miliaceum TaxID=4540 RepID=A0A3L6QAM2_PANMI|nr:hypothetical protein C2845_PM15G04540 [Panicum miliaceum]